MYIRQLLCAATAIVSLLCSPSTEARTETETLALRVSSPNLDTIFYLDNKPEWTPSLTEHVIEYMGTKYVIPNTGDTKITIVLTEATGVNGISSEHATAEIRDNTIIVKTGNQSTILRIADELGRVVLTREIEPHSVYDCSIDNLERGIYILSVNSRTMKFVKK